MSTAAYAPDAGTRALAVADHPRAPPGRRPRGGAGRRRPSRRAGLDLTDDRRFAAAWVSEGRVAAAMHANEWDAVTACFDGVVTTPRDLDVALAAARAGAAVLDEMFGTDTDLARQHKTATDFATVADRAAEQAILDVIRAARPDDGFEGEELGLVNEGDGRSWLVDPLCGTVNFAAGSPSFCVNIALVEGATTTTAVVAHPPTGESYWAEGGDFDVLGRVAAPAPNRLVNINADGPLDRDFVGAQLAADPAFRATFNPRVESTTLALAWVASGQRLAYVTDGRCERSVHFTAGIALCQAAGVVITDFDGEAVHTGPGIIAARDAGSHATLMELVARYRSGS